MTSVLRVLRSGRFQRHAVYLSGPGKRAESSSSVSVGQSRPNWKLFVGASLVGAGVGAGYSFWQRQKVKQAVLNPEGDGKPIVWKEAPDVPISREVVHSPDPIRTEIILFQYRSCPFCCKVRTFLDYHGISYKVVEVNPVLKQQLKWSKYRKVPILLAKVDDGYIQLNDSTMIVSAIKSYLHDTDYTLKEVANFYPSIAFMDDDNQIKQEILNRYFLMYQGATPEDQKQMIADERKWRKWADSDLVHTLSPNVYRTREEALQAFRYFAEVGEWDRLFSPWETSFVVHVGAAAMWMIGKRLKKRHNLKDDVRQSLYDSCNTWLKHLKSKGTPFHGGSSPDLADLAVFGILNSIEGCIAFGDLVQNTKISQWYFRTKEAVANSTGAQMRS